MIEVPHIAGMEVRQVMPVEGCEGGKTGCETRQRHIFHHLLPHAVIRVNFRVVYASSKGPASLRLSMLGER